MNTMELFDVELPEQFVCPFTKNILQEPVLSTSCGHHFERAAVEGRVHLCCPVDGIPLPQTLVPAREFKAVINHWLKLYKLVKYMENQIKLLSNKEGNKFDLLSGINDSKPLIEMDPLFNPTYLKTQPHQPKPNNTINLPNSNKILKPTVSSDYPSKPIPIAHPNPVQSKNTIVVPNTPIVVPSNNDTGSSNSGDKATVDPRKYKTKLCRSWVQTGTCTYEHTCCFAHGDEEIRDPAANIRVLDALGFSTQPKPAAEGPKTRSKGRGVDTKSASEAGKLTSIGSDAKPLRSPSPISQESRIIYFSPEQLSELGVPGILPGENNSRPFPFAF